jgi:hypothetical protein
MVFDGLWGYGEMWAVFRLKKIKEQCLDDGSEGSNIWDESSDSCLDGHLILKKWMSLFIKTPPILPTIEGLWLSKFCCTSHFMPALLLPLSQHCPQPISPCQSLATGSWTLVLLGGL